MNTYYVDLTDDDVVYCGENGEYTMYNIPKDYKYKNIKSITYAKLVPTKNFSGTKCSNCNARHKNNANRTHKFCYKCGAEFI